LKRNYIVLLSACIAILSLGYVFNSAAADKGRPYYEKTGQIVWDIKTEEKIVALTFDDGPHPKYTKDILDLLDQYDAKATFFVVGEHAEKNPDIVFRMYEEGHELANHTYTHPFNGRVPQLMEEIKQTNDVIFSITGYSPVLFRPVEGQYTDALIEAVTKEGFKVVMWSWHQDTEDWKDPGVKKIVKNVLKDTKQGDVILFHDGGGNRQQTVQALAEILPELQKEGYEFVTISELLKVQKASAKKP
jgi:peptidoglycan-N-acetylglucosamine deacetylase